jgi:hypothetical protein
MTLIKLEKMDLLNTFQVMGGKTRSKSKIQKCGIKIILLKKGQSGQSSKSGHDVEISIIKNIFEAKRWINLA